MNNMNSDENAYINTHLSILLGLTRLEQEHNSTRHEIYDGTLEVPYYSLFPPQFTTKWKATKTLIKLMAAAGYDEYTLKQIEQDHWTSSFICNKGPCSLHGTTKLDKHGSIHHLIALNPSLATAYAAIVALSTGTKVTIKRKSPHIDQIINIPTNTINGMLIIVNKYQRLIDNRGQYDQDS